MMHDPLNIKSYISTHVMYLRCYAGP